MVQRYTANGATHRTKEKFKFDLSEYTLTLMALLFLTQNASATHRLRTKVMEFLDQVDESQYSSNADLCWRIALATDIGNAVLRHNARTLTAVEHRVLENMDYCEYHGLFFDCYRENIGHSVEGEIVENELSDEEVSWIDNYVSTRLRFSYLWENREFFREFADRIDAGDMGDISEFNDVALDRMESIVQQGRQARALSAQESQDFSTGERSFEAAIRAAHAARNKPQSVVKTGLALMNEMLGGGYEGSRVYIHFGRSGDWKSGMLCSAAFWACDPRYNPSYTTRDPTRKPAVLFLTMENDVYETIERMISFSLGSHVDLRGADVDNIVRMMENAFSSETCKFIFKYRQSRSISTADLEGMIHDLYLQGYEVVMIVQDYIKRIKSVEQHRDARHLELGSVVDELSVIAKRYNIPVVTGMQLNREAYVKFETAIKSGRQDAIKDLGASNVGESINVYENADCVIFQGRVSVASLDNRLFLTARRAKMRGKRVSTLDFFAQPFDLDANGDVNEMKLVEDAHLPKSKWAGMREIGDGIQQMYDPQADREPDPRAPEPRSTGVFRPSSSTRRTPVTISNPPPNARVEVVDEDDLEVEILDDSEVDHFKHL